MRRLTLTFPEVGDLDEESRQWLKNHPGPPKTRPDD
jgi:hypothetical protein